MKMRVVIVVMNTTKGVMKTKLERKKNKACTEVKPKNGCLKPR